MRATFFIEDRNEGGLIKDSMMSTAQIMLARCGPYAEQKHWIEENVKLIREKAYSCKYENIKAMNMKRFRKLFEERNQ